MSHQRLNRRSTHRTVAVIPARLHSTRLPEKLLLSETGKPLLQHTFEGVQTAHRINRIIVAAESPEIERTAMSFGAEVVMTDPQAKSGTDRVAEAVRNLDSAEIVVNVQGDEPEISGESIDLAVEMLERQPDAVMSTLCTPIRSKAQLFDPNCVKVVFDQHGRALYFSRSPIPFVRDQAELDFQQNRFFQHIGLYAYRRNFLSELARMPKSDLERLENLEQLRVLSAGHSIVVGQIDEPTVGIDTPADYAAFVRREQSRQRTAA